MGIERVSLTVFLFLHFVIELCGQGDYRKGYVITNSGDSLIGYVSYKMRSTKLLTCVFKDVHHHNKTRFEPDDILAYGFETGGRYVSKEIAQEGKKVFVEYLVNGKIDLYRWRDIYLVEFDSMVVLPKPQSKLIGTNEGQRIKTDNRYIGLLNYFMADCGLSANKIKYNEKQFTYLVQNYNRCKGSSGIVYKDKLPWTKFTSEVFSGFDFSVIDGGGFPENQKRSVSMTSGAGILISSPRQFDRLFLAIEPSYTKKIFQYYFDLGSTKEDHIIRGDYFKVPVGIRYNIFNGLISPYLKLGVLKYFVNKASWSILSESELNGVVTTDFHEYALGNRNRGGYWGGLGLEGRIYNNIRAFVEVRYEKGNGILEWSASSLKTYNILFGVSL